MRSRGRDERESVGRVEWRGASEWNVKETRHEEKPPFE